MITPFLVGLIVVFLVGILFSALHKLYQFWDMGFGEGLIAIGIGLIVFALCVYMIIQVGRLTCYVIPQLGCGR